MKTELQISVRTLLEKVFRSGDLNLVFRTSDYAYEGIRTHKYIQNSRPETYVSEVPISHQVEIGSYLITISGRIDGVYKNSDRIIIDEIKPTRMDLDSPSLYDNTSAWSQVKIYA